MGIYLSTLCSVVQEQNEQGIGAYNFKYYSFRKLCLGVVYFRGSPFGEGVSVLSITVLNVSKVLHRHSEF